MTARSAASPGPGAAGPCQTGAMAYDEALAARIRALLKGERGVSEKRMFGGLAFLVDGHMAAAANSHGELMVRIEPDECAELVALPGARPMVMRGRELRGWLNVDATVLDTDDDLAEWVRRGTAYARTLPPKD